MIEAEKDELDDRYDSMECGEDHWEAFQDGLCRGPVHKAGDRVLQPAPALLRRDARRRVAAGKTRRAAAHPGRPAVRTSGTHALPWTLRIRNTGV